MEKKEHRVSGWKGAMVLAEKESNRMRNGQEQQKKQICQPQKEERQLYEERDWSKQLLPKLNCKKIRQQDFSQTVGTNGPVLLQDGILHEKLEQFVHRKPLE